jgi:hypothetical protein
MPQVTAASYNIGSPQFSAWVNNFNNNHPQASPPPTSQIKAVFLLELSAGVAQSLDLCIQKTLNYYWNTYPQEFTKYPVVDTAGTIENNIKYLNYYYNLGVRYFIGFSYSNILAGVLEWFNFHSDATGMTNYGNADSLSVAKNIYRFSPNNSTSLNPITNQINNADIVYYIYQENAIVSEEILQTLQNISTIKSLKTYPGNSSTINVTDLQQFLYDSTPDSIIILLLIDDRNTYINLYSNGLVFEGQQYDVSCTQNPVIPSGIALVYLTNKYNTINFKGTDTSIIWRNGYNTLGDTNYTPPTLDVLNVLNQFINNEQIENVNSHYGTVQFDPVTKDTIYYGVLLQQFNGEKFINSYIYTVDPYLGIYTANFVNNTPVSTSIIPISPNKPFIGKTIALLDLGYSNPNDNLIKTSLYYFWYKYTTLPKFPIIDITGSTSSQLANLLTSYYNQGYRIFLGPNFGYLLSAPDTLNWFSSHPDTFCLSLFTGITIPNVPKNIYSFESSDSDTITLLIPKMLESEKIYYIYSYGDPIGAAVNSILEQLFNLVYPRPYKSFEINDPVDPLNHTLSVPNMFNFFGIDPSNNPVTTKDIIIILTNTDLQNYLNLYNDVSMNQIVAPQYEPTGNINLLIPFNGTVLNKNFYSVIEAYPNTSYLWNENNQYLTNKYSSDAISYQLLNALKTIQYILKGKDFKLLGSHSGCFDFGTNNKIKFASRLFKQYQSESNSFVNNQIIFNDALLGTFSALFI